MCDFSYYGGPSSEWLAVQAALPPPQVDQTLEDRQKATNAWREETAAAAMKDLRSHVRIIDYSIPTRDGSSIEARSYRPVNTDPMEMLPIYIHFHGGGFFFGTLSSEDAICSRIAINTGVIVLNVNYRHTPRFTYPTAWNDAQDAFEWLHDNVNRIGCDRQGVVVGGISGGAQLAASLVLEKNLHKMPVSHPPIAGQVLMIPCLVHVDCYNPQLAKLKHPSVSSYIENKDAPILSMETIRFFTDQLKIEKPEETDTKLNPGNAVPEQVWGLPPTTFGITGLDPLRDEGLLYAKMLAEEGVPTNIHVFKGVPHGFRRYGGRLSASKKWDETMEQGILWALSKPVASCNFQDAVTRHLISIPNEAVSHRVKILWANTMFSLFGGHLQHNLDPDDYVEMPVSWPLHEGVDGSNNQDNIKSE